MAYVFAGLYAMKIRFIFLLLLSPSALAHYIPSLTQATTVDASLAVSWSSASQVGDYDFWQIPGTLMGGDAWPTRKGVDINEIDRKSTRLNSSHVRISYAVFCL